MSQDYTNSPLGGALLASVMALAASEISTGEKLSTMRGHYRSTPKSSGKNRDKIKAARKQRRKSK